MTRYLCWVAGLGVVALPDWATACRPGWGRPVYVEPAVYCAPAYPVPVYPAYPVCPPPVYGYPPASGHVLPPPQVEPAPKAAAPAPAPAPTSGMGATGMGAAPSRPPAVEPGVAGGERPPAPSSAGGERPPTPTKPAAGSDSGVSPVPKAAPPARPAAAPDPAFPVVEIPKSLELPKVPDPGAKGPPGAAPKAPEFRPAPAPKVAPEPAPGPAAPAVPSPAPPDGGSKLPRLVLPGEPAPKAPDAVVPAGPSATPTSAPPAPDLAIPPPAVPDAAPALPSLTLPPDSPVNVSRSSPLTGAKAGPAVSVFPANGGGRLANGYRAVGFYNHTGREIALTIEGRAVKLPAKSYLEAKLGPTFTWGHGDNPATQQTVPAGSTGLDIVFKD